MEAKIEVTNLITPFINTYKTINAEVSNLFDVGLTDYLYSQTDKYYFTNTFIHRGEKVKFSDIYYPVSCKYKHLITDFKDTTRIFQNYKNITIVGSAGSGKTTLLKFIFLDAIKRKSKIPILIELRNLNDDVHSLEKLIMDKVLKTYLKPSEDTFIRALKKGAFLFLLDGYDEIFTKKKQSVNKQIDQFIDAYSDNWFLITTRPGSGIQSFSRFHDFTIQNLTTSEINGFVENIVTNSERKERILTTIKDNRNSSFKNYLGNPLLLSMFILAFESHPEIPTRKSAFYRNVFDTLYSKHDGFTKNGFPREKITGLQREDFEIILGVFSYLTLAKGEYSFTSESLSDFLKKVQKGVGLSFVVEDLIYDLETSISIIVLDGFEYKFPHRSMQEYFTAYFISNLPTDKKKLAYDNLIQNLAASSTDSSYNLWQLFEELDHTAFKKNFLIPKLKEIEAALKDKRGKNLIKSFFDVIDAVLAYIPGVAPGERSLKIYRTAGINSGTLFYCRETVFDDIHNFPKIAGCEGELMAYSKGHLISYKKSQVIDILYKHGLHDIIAKIVKSISSQILKYESDIEKDTSTIDDLLQP